MLRTNKAILLRSLCLGALLCASPLLIDARASAQEKGRPKNLRERALEQDVEFDSGELDLVSVSLFGLIKQSSAIVVGKIASARSFFDESGDPILEYGEIITTEYDVEILSILKNMTLDRILPIDKLAPAALTTRLKIARNGGVVSVNGHKASIKVKGYEGIKEGSEYVFFLNWSPDYKAYVLTYGIFGAVAVEGNKSLRPLVDAEKAKATLSKLNLESLATEIAKVP